MGLLKRRDAKESSGESVQEITPDQQRDIQATALEDKSTAELQHMAARALIRASEPYFTEQANMFYLEAIALEGLAILKHLRENPDRNPPQSQP